MDPDSNAGQNEKSQATPTAFVVALAFAVAGLVCLPAGAVAAGAADPNKPADVLHGRVQFRYDNFFVNADKGRFREDQWMTDGNTGGLDDLYLRIRLLQNCGLAYIT